MPVGCCCRNGHCDVECMPYAIVHEGELGHIINDLVKSAHAEMLEPHHPDGTDGDHEAAVALIHLALGPEPTFCIHLVVHSAVTEGEIDSKKFMSWSGAPSDHNSSNGRVIDTKKSGL